MNKYFKRYIGVVIAWVIMIIVSFSFMPRFTNLVNQKGDTRIPSSMSSKVASRIGSEFHKSGQNTRRLVVVFNSGSKFNSQQTINMSTTLTKLKKSQKQLGIESMVTPNDSLSAQKQLIAKDQTTQLVILDVDKTIPVKTMNNQIKKAVKTVSLRTYVTSFKTIQRDTNNAARNGLVKATVIIAIFILLLLLVVFRSVIIPLISVLTTSVAYIVSLWAIGSLASEYGLPISRDTQAGLMLVFATLGTGYALFYFNSFKNQLVAGKDGVEASLAVQKRFTQLTAVSAGVLAIAFGSLGFVNYSLVQSFAGIGIGIIILLAATLTFLPFFTYWLGNRVFLPSNNLKAHDYNRSWNFLAGKSAKYPLVALVLAILIAIPFVVNSKGPVSFDPTREISTKSSSAKDGYKVIKNHFPAGIAEPITVYIKADHKLDNDADLREIDRVSNQLTANKEVSAINSVTQPEGEPLQQLYMQEQLQIVTGSLDTNMSSLNRVAKGLKTTKISKSPLTKTDRSVTTIADRVSQIQAYNAANNVTETPTEVVNQVQAELSQSNHKRMNRYQRAMVEEALQRATADQAQQDKINSALNGITSQTDSATQSVSQFRMELAALQSKIQGYGTQVKSSTKEIKQSRDFLNEMAKSPAGQTFYIPKDVLKSSTFRQSIKRYLSDDKKTAKISVILKNDPNGKPAMDYVNEISSQMKNNFAGTTLKNAQVVVGGVPATLANAKTISKANFVKMAVIFAGILIVLSMLVSASILQAAYVGIIGLIAYFMSLGFSKWFSHSFLQQSQLTSVTPVALFILLFAFLMNFALAVFITNRQAKQPATADQMVSSVGKLGTMIMLAMSVVIVGSLALTMSGVLTMIQVAIGLIFGIVIIGIIIPVSLPSLNKLTYDNYFGNLFNLNKKHVKKSTDE